MLSNISSHENPETNLISEAERNIFLILFDINKYETSNFKVDIK